MPSYSRRRLNAARKNIAKVKDETTKIVEELTNEVRNKQEDQMPEHKYWTNKPVVDYNGTPLLSRKIEDLSTRTVYSQENPLKLPTGFNWIVLDLDNEETAKNVESFLRNNYLIDVTDKFSLNYTKDFMKWTLGKDGSFLGITDNNNNLCATISYRLRSVTVFDKTEVMADTNFLCVKKDLRNKGVPVVLIDEMVRRVHKLNISAGVFTTERQVPSATTKMRYYHRPLNYLKLTKLGFITIKDLTPENGQKFFEPSPTPDIFRVATPADYVTVFELYKSEMTIYNIHANYTLEEFLHHFFDNEFMKTYVLLDKQNNVCDYFSFYLLPYSVKDSNESINVAYLYSHSTNKHDVDEMLDNFIYSAYNMKLDLINITDVMQVRKALLIDDKKDPDSDDESQKKPFQHKFIKGTRKLYLNFFNWECPRVMPGQVAWVAI